MMDSIVLRRIMLSVKSGGCRHALSMIIVAMYWIVNSGILLETIEASEETTPVSLTVWRTSA